MKDFAHKIFVTLGYITLIIISVIPVFVHAQAAEAVSAFGNGVIGVTGMMTFITPSLYVLMTLAGGAVALAGLFLDFILNISVVNLAARLNGITSINTTWAVIRDIANMSFIFILLYEGIRMVLGLESSGVKKVVGNIVIAAVLVNFSLFFTKVVIDASNIITLGFYNSIVGTGNTYTGLAGVLMNILRMSMLYAPENIAKTVFSGANGITILVGNTVFLTIAAFVFLAISVMFVIRYLAFIFLLIMSPIAFVSMAVPGLTYLKDQYVKTLISQALFAPVFMLLTWVMLTLAGDSGFLSATNVANTSWWEVLTNNTKGGSQVISTIVDYILIIGLLIQTLIISKTVATKAGFVTKDMVNKGTSFLGGAMFGGAAWAGRQTIGRGAAAIAKNEDLQREADKGNLFAKAGIWASKKTAQGTFDARRSFLGEKAASNLGIDMGKGMPFAPDAGKGGFAGVKADKKKETETKLDEITKRYKDKDDWNKLAEVFKERSDDDQKYIYKSLSAKERVGLDMAMGGPNVNTKFRDKLNKEEKDKTEEETIKYYTKDKKWNDLVTYFNTKTDNADKQFIYKTLSDRDRVAFEKVLSPNVTIKSILDASLTQEQLEKTKEVAKKVERQERDEQHIRDIEDLATGPQPVGAAAIAAAYDALLSGTGRNVFSPKNARNLSDAALTNPEVVMRLKAKHLEDIQKNNDDIADDTIRTIKRIIDTTPYPPALAANKTSQQNYMSKSNNSDFWNI